MTRAWIRMVYAAILLQAFVYVFFYRYLSHVVEHSYDFNVSIRDSLIEFYWELGWPIDYSSCCQMQMPEFLSYSVLIFILVLDGVFCWKVIAFVSELLAASSFGFAYHASKIAAAAVVAALYLSERNPVPYIEQGFIGTSGMWQRELRQLEVFIVVLSIAYGVRHFTSPGCSPETQSRAELGRKVPCADRISVDFAPISVLATFAATMCLALSQCGYLFLDPNTWTSFQSLFEAIAMEYRFFPFSQFWPFELERSGSPNWIGILASVSLFIAILIGGFCRIVSKNGPRILSRKYEIGRVLALMTFVAIMLSDLNLFDKVMNEYYGTGIRWISILVAIFSYVTFKHLHQLFFASWTWLLAWRSQSA